MLLIYFRDILFNIVYCPCCSSLSQHKLYTIIDKMVQKQISNIYLYLAKKIKYNLATFLLNVKGKNVDKTHIHY